MDTCCNKCTGAVSSKGAKGDKGDAGTAAPSLLTLNNMVFVAKNGSDSTGLVNRLDKPFLTILAAQSATTSGYTIYVYPGSYTISNLGKDGVSYHFMDGVNLSFSTGFVLSANINIFVSGFAKCTGTRLVNVTGATNSKIKIHSGTFSGHLFDVAAIGTVVKLHIEAEQDLTLTSLFGHGDNAATTSSFVHVKAQTIYTDGGFAPIATGAGNNNIFMLEAKRIINNSATAFPTIIYSLGGLTIVKGDIFVSNSNSAQGSFFNDNGGDGIVIVEGDIYQTAGSATSLCRTGTIDFRGIVVSTGAISTEGTGTTIINDKVITNYAGPSIIHTSGKTIVKNAIKNSSNGQDGISVGASGLQLKQGTHIEVTGVANSVSAGSPFDIKVYPGATANKAVNVNITQQIASLLIDSQATT